MFLSAALGWPHSSPEATERGRAAVCWARALRSLILDGSVSPAWCIGCGGRPWDICCV